MIGTAGSKVGSKVCSVTTFEPIFAVVSGGSVQRTLVPSTHNGIEGHLAVSESTNCNILNEPIE